MGQQLLDLLLPLLLVTPSASNTTQKGFAAAFAVQQLKLTPELCSTTGSGLLQSSARQVERQRALPTHGITAMPLARGDNAGVEAFRALEKGMQAKARQHRTLARGSLTGATHSGTEQSQHLLHIPLSPAMAWPDPCGNHADRCSPGVIRCFGIAARLHKRMACSFREPQPATVGIVRLRNLECIEQHRSLWGCTVKGIQWKESVAVVASARDLPELPAGQQHLFWISGKPPTAPGFRRWNHLSRHDRFLPMVSLRSKREPEISESIPQIIEALLGTITCGRQGSAGGQQAELLVALRLIKA